MKSFMVRVYGGTGGHLSSLMVFVEAQSVALAIDEAFYFFNRVSGFNKKLVRTIEVSILEGYL